MKRRAEFQTKLLKKIKQANFVYVCGNGGSAANAEHFTNDLFSKGVKAICLNSNVSIMTMIANDFDYSEIYSRQLELYGTENDLLITISCSGTSPNITSAIRVAKQKGMDVFEFEDFKDFDSKINYGTLENRHQELIHRIKALL